MYKAARGGPARSKADVYSVMVETVKCLDQANKLPEYSKGVNSYDEDRKILQELASGRLQAYRGMGGKGCIKHISKQIRILKKSRDANPPKKVNISDVEEGLYVVDSLGSSDHKDELSVKLPLKRIRKDVEASESSSSLAAKQVKEESSDKISNDNSIETKNHQDNSLEPFTNIQQVVEQKVVETNKCDLCDYQHDVVFRVINHLKENMHFSASRVELLNGKLHAIVQPMALKVPSNLMLQKMKLVVVCSKCKTIFNEPFTAILHQQAMHVDFSRVYYHGTMLKTDKIILSRVPKCLECGVVFASHKLLHLHWKEQSFSHHHPLARLGIPEKNSTTFLTFHCPWCNQLNHFNFISVKWHVQSCKKGPARGKAHYSVMVETVKRFDKGNKLPEYSKGVNGYDEDYKILQEVNSGRLQAYGGLGGKFCIRNISKQIRILEKRRGDVKPHKNRI